MVCAIRWFMDLSKWVRVASRTRWIKAVPASTFPALVVAVESLSSIIEAFGSIPMDVGWERNHGRR